MKNLKFKLVNGAELFKDWSTLTLGLPKILAAISSLRKDGQFFKNTNTVRIFKRKNLLIPKF